MTRARLGALLALSVVSVLPFFVRPPYAVAQEEPTLDKGVLIVLVPAVSFEELLAFPEMRALAAAGGAGFYHAPSHLERTLTEGFGSQVYPLPTGNVDLRLTIVKQGFGPAPAPLTELGVQVRAKAEQFSVERLLVVVAGVSRSPEMRADKDDQLPIIVGDGDPTRLFETPGVPVSLASDSTRRTGVVIEDDVVPTIVAFEGGSVPGHPTPEAGDGSAIRFVSQAAPFSLHQRYLAQRRMSVPVGTAAALYVAAAGLLGVAFVARGDRVPTRWRRIAGWATLSVPMLAAGLLAAGHLPELSYATAVPMVAIVTVFGTLAFSPLEQRDATLVPAGIGLAVLAYLALEAVLGWSGMLTPLVGGTQLDGGRFFGLPNIAIGLLVGSGLWVAQRLRTLGGVALLCGLGLFAGLPLVGSNLGGAVTAFAAAGLWLVARERERLGTWKGRAAFLIVTTIGTAVVLLAHAVSPVATHITRFESSVGGISGVFGRYVDRLRVGFDLIAGSPAALIPVVGLPIALLVALRPPGPIRETFERRPAWRDAVVVTMLSGIVAYLANDSGPAAAGIAFGMGLGGMLGVSLLSPAGKMVEP